ncbi:unnamed protein product [Paramecium octaurelia]|uniref:Uncharacterized protein n=1 Tax=Paramecium octaurelia TaxID=43137 RepID=A0A8S1VQS6_PAROT|nr:unnamed protein product [Paramecium octaurelia]
MIQTLQLQILIDALLKLLRFKDSLITFTKGQFQLQNQCFKNLIIYRRMSKSNYSLSQQWNIIVSQGRQ